MKVKMSSKVRIGNRYEIFHLASYGNYHVNSCKEFLHAYRVNEQLLSIPNGKDIGIIFTTRTFNSYVIKEGDYIIRDLNTFEIIVTDSKNRVEEIINGKFNRHAITNCKFIDKNYNDFPFIIAFEGMDGIGKTTQIELLKEYFNDENIKYVHFPVYNSPTGELIKRYLKGEIVYKPEEEVVVASGLYTLNRLEFFNTEYCDIFSYIFDRSIGSNFIHMGAKIYKLLSDKRIPEYEIYDNIDNYMSNLMKIEFLNYNMPVPDLTFYLKGDIDVVMENYKNRDELELNERLEHIECVNKVSDHIVEYNNWHVINCTENGKMKPKEIIHKEIVNIINKFLERDESLWKF